MGWSTILPISFICNHKLKPRKYSIFIASCATVRCPKVNTALNRLSKDILSFTNLCYHISVNMLHWSVSKRSTIYVEQWKCLTGEIDLPMWTFVDNFIYSILYCSVYRRIQQMKDYKHHIVNDMEFSVQPKLTQDKCTEENANPWFDINYFVESTHAIESRVLTS